jgi:hypothetical protein
MQQPPDISPLSKVYYRPLEAAIRWCGLEQYEQHILDVLQRKKLPEPDDFPEWPALRLNAERIYDAIVNRELPCGIDGITVQNAFSIDHPLLTIRHVDLRAWMIRYYPEQRPDFLFSQIEQKMHPSITLEAINTLVLEREALKSSIERRDQEFQILRDQYSALLRASEATNRPSGPDEALSSRAETTYLHIVGGLLGLLLGRTPSGQPYSSFKTQESIVSAMIAHCGELMGITERTLHAKFAAAKRKLAGE